MEINKNIPVPLYYQLKELLQNDIAKGKYKPGDLIPTEVKLMERYDLSRTTVRQAINALVYEGYLDRKKAWVQLFYLGMIRMIKEICQIRLK